MTAHSYFSKSLPLLALTFAFLPTLHADQTWVGTDPGGALWSTGANWTSAVPGAGDVAIFDSTSANLATTLGADQSVAGIKVLNPTGAVSVAATNVLTVGSAGIDLSSATQNLTLNSAVVLGANQAWNVGTGFTLTDNGVTSGSGIALTKTGAGVLRFTGANTFTGGVTVSQGTLALKANAAAGTGVITLADATTLRMERISSTVSIFPGNAITVAPASTVVMVSDNAGNGYGGVITGDAASTYQIGSAGNLGQVSFSLGANTQQFGSFLGTVKIVDGASLRFSSTAGVNNGGASTTFDLGTSGSITTRNSAIVNLGAVKGTGTLYGSGGANGTGTYSIGGLNTDNTFDGVIADSAVSRLTALTKVGSGALTLTGTSVYSGPTAVNGGKLLVNGALAASTAVAGATSAVTVGTAGTLGGTGTIAGTVTNNGTIAPGASAGTLTISNNLVMTTNVLSNLSYELKGSDTTVGAGVNDLLTGIINLTLDGTLNVTALDAFTGLSSGTWRLINYTGSLTDNGLALGTMPATDPGTSFSLDTSTPGQVNLVLASVPEVSAAILSGMASLALLGRRRRRPAGQ